MKPASVINRGENFVTLRATTDRPEELREALAQRDVLHVFKGDQNQGWDAVLANHCLRRAVGDESADLTFFIQDEKLGTADARLARLWRAQGRRYVLTEDYYRGRSGAVWEHQDTSFGLFFTEAVSPEQFAGAAVHLHRAAEVWEKHAAALLADGEFVAALDSLGVTAPRPSGGLRPDAGTRLGPAVHALQLSEFFTEHPVAALYYAFTKTDGLYGLVPVENEDVTLSSVSAGHPELREGARWLLVRAAAQGALRLAGGAAHRRGIKQRVRRLSGWASDYLGSHPEASITDFQVDLGRWLTGEIFPADRVELDRTSRFTRVGDTSGVGAAPSEQSFHFLLDLALQHPREFSEAYNEALNRAGLGLQRVKYDPQTGRYAPPFFVEFAAAGAGAPVYRYGIALEGVERTTVVLSNATAGDRVLEADGPVRSLADFVATLQRELGPVVDLAIVGKAAPFAAELQRAPRGLGLPRQGSKYVPMVDHLLAGLRARGVLDQPTGLLIRIGLNALDRLDAMGEMPLRLPRFLEGPLGRTATCRELAQRWRDVAEDARELLELLSHCHFGQHVHLVKAISLNARGGDWETALAGDARLRKLAKQLEAQWDGSERLRRLGKDVPPAAVECMVRLTARREELLRARRAAPTAVTAEAEREREAVECGLLLLFGAYVRRLWQRAESLPYLNDRPYTLALYLLFGPDIFAPICRQVEFDVEYISPCVTGSIPVPCA